MNTLFNIKETALNTLNEGVTLSAKAIIGAKHVTCSTEGYHMYDITLGTNNTVSVVRQGENNFLRNANLTDMIVATTNGLSKSYKNFTTDFVMVSMDTETAYETMGKSLFINHEEASVSTTKIDNHREYAMLMYTSSSVKNSKAIWYDKAIASSNMELINIIIPNVIDEMNNELSLTKALKFASRPGLAWTPNVNFAELDRVATFDGNFEAKHNTLDGQVVMKSSYAMRIFKLHNEVEACKLILQARIYGVMKFQVVVVPDEAFLEMIDALNERGGVNYIGNGNNTNMILDSNAIKCNIKPQSLVFSMMSIGKVTTSQASKQLLEKVIVEAQRQNRLEEVVEYFFNQGHKQIARVIADILSQEDKNVSLNDTYILDVLAKTNPSNPIVNAKKVEDAYQTLKNMIDGLNIELVDEDNNATMYNTVVSGDITAMLGEGLIPEDSVVIGKFSKLMDKDPSAREKYGKFVGIKYPSMFINEYACGKVISIEEMVALVHASNLSQRAKRGLTTYFRNMSDATIMFPASRDIFDTCAGMDTDFDKICVIFDKMIVDVLGDRQQVLKISAETPKDIANLKYVSKELATEIKALNNTIETNTTFNINDESFYAKMFCKQIDTNDSIGSITLSNNRTIALLSECLRGNFAPAENFLKENLGQSKGVKRAYEVTRPTVDVAYVDEMITKMQIVVWNRANIIAFLEDCSRVFRLYQETQIDGAKTGIYLDRRLTARSIKPTSCMPVTVKNVNGTPILVREIPEMKMVKTKFHYLDPVMFTDVLGGIQDALIDATNIEFREVMEVNKHLFKYTKEQVIEFGTIVEKVASTKKYSAMLSTMQTLKSAYVSLTNKYVEELTATEEDEAKEVIKETYTNECNTIGNAIKNTFAKFGITRTDRMGAFMLMLGCLTVKDKQMSIDAHSKNRFAYNCVPDLVYSYLIGESYKAYGTVLQTGLELEGTVELIDGVSANGLVIKERYTGTVTFVDGTVFATIQTEVKESTEEFVMIVPKADVVNINVGEQVYRLNHVFFNGNKSRKYEVTSVVDINIDIDENRNTQYGAFWKRTECLMITVK